MIDPDINVLGPEDLADAPRHFASCRKCHALVIVNIGLPTAQPWDPGAVDRTLMRRYFGAEVIALQGFQSYYGAPHECRVAAARADKGRG